MDGETNAAADKSATGSGHAQDQGSCPGAISLGSSRASPAPNAPILEKDDARFDGLGCAEDSDGGSDPEAPGDTFRFQPQLPKLQVPPLDDTLGRYLDVVEPLLSPKAFERTRALVKEVRSWVMESSRARAAVSRRCQKGFQENEVPPLRATVERCSGRRRGFSILRR